MQPRTSVTKPQGQQNTAILEGTKNQRTQEDGAVQRDENFGVTTSGDTCPATS